MALKMVRKKKAKPAAAGRRKKTDSKKFVDAIDVQLRLAKGEKVTKGRGVAKSWMVDGSAFGEGMVLVPRVGAKPLFGKSAYVVDTSKPKPPTAELNELRKLAVAGKLTARIGRAKKATRRAKK